MVRAVRGRPGREQRGDRPALDDARLVVGQAPLDVLGLAEVRFDPSAEARQPQDLRVGQDRLRLKLRLDGLLLGATDGTRGSRAACVPIDRLSTTTPSRTL